MTAEVIAIGSELTSGSKLDTNSQWLSRELESLGWTVTRHTSVADDMDAMVAEFRAAAERSQVVLITGGLGPTLDDITRDALALAFNQPLVMDEESLAAIKAIFAARGREMPDRNHRQAERPASAEVLPNSCGTAPGLLMTAGPRNTLFAVMPGVPAEMKPMFERQIRPRLIGAGTVIRRIVIRTFGFGESDAERLLGDLTARGRNPEVGITASEAVISLWITARAQSEAECVQMIESCRQVVYDRLAEAVYGEGDIEIEEVLAQHLDLLRMQVVLNEGPSTGGLIAHWITDHPDSSGCLHSARVLPQQSFLTDLNPADPDWPQRWPEWARKTADAIRTETGQRAVLLTSPFDVIVSDRGVSVRRGFIAAAFDDQLETADVSMSGNLAIFRQRAARTPLTACDRC